MSSRNRTDVQLMIHDNYNAVVSPGATKTSGNRPEHTATNPKPYLINSLYIENMDSSIDVYVSFDKGTKWKTIKAGTYLSLQTDSFTSYMIKSASGTPAIEALYGVEN